MNERLGVFEPLTGKRSQSFEDESCVTFLKATLGFIKLVKEPLNVVCGQRSKDCASQLICSVLQMFAMEGCNLPGVDCFPGHLTSRVVSACQPDNIERQVVLTHFCDHVMR